MSREDYYITSKPVEGVLAITYQWSCRKGGYERKRFIEIPAGELVKERILGADGYYRCLKVDYLFFLKKSPMVYYGELFSRDDLENRSSSLVGHPKEQDIRDRLNSPMIPSEELPEMVVLTPSGYVYIVHEGEVVEYLEFTEVRDKVIKVRHSEKGFNV